MQVVTVIAVTDTAAEAEGGVVGGCRFAGDCRTVDASQSPVGLLETSALLGKFDVVAGISVDLA